MSTDKRRVGALAVAVLIVVLVGCGSPADPPESSAPPASRATSTPSVPSQSPPITSSSPAAADATAVDVTIVGGVVTPTNGQAQGKVGKPIVLRVGSDVPDSLHVHSVPEHTFQVEPRPEQEFEFTVDVPGQVDVELHDLNRTVVTIQVRP